MTAHAPKPAARRVLTDESAPKKEKKIRVSLTDAQVDTVNTALCHYEVDMEARLHAMTPYSPEWERQRSLLRLVADALQAIAPHTAYAEEEEE
jgi:hypothetical protein